MIEEMIAQETVNDQQRLCPVCRRPLIFCSCRPEHNDPSNEFFQRVAEWKARKDAFMLATNGTFADVAIGETVEIWHGGAVVEVTKIEPQYNKRIGNYGIYMARKRFDRNGRLCVLDSEPVVMK